MKLILASKSPRRKTILENMGYELEIEPSHADESQIKENNPEKLVQALAELKAETIAKNHEEGVVLGADTVVYHEGDIIGKARSDEEAFRTLKRLLGKEHEVYTGLCVINANTGEKKKIFTKSLIKLREVGEEELNRYVKGGHYRGKAGAYNLEHNEFSPFVEKADNKEYKNLMEINFAKGVTLLKSMGIMPKDKD